MKEDELYQVSALLELVVSGGERQTSDTEVRAAIWEACGDSRALQLLVDLLNVRLASLVDWYVNDAFGTVHMAHASTKGIAKCLKPSIARFLMQKGCQELDYLVGAVSNPKRPFANVVGGSKVSSNTLPPKSLTL